MAMSWTVKIEQDENGNFLVPLPEDLLAQLKMGIGDSFFWDGSVSATGEILLTKAPQTAGRGDEGEHD